MENFVSVVFVAHFVLINWCMVDLVGHSGRMCVVLDVVELEVQTLILEILSHLVAHSKNRYTLWQRSQKGLVVAVDVDVFVVVQLEVVERVKCLKC